MSLGRPRQAAGAADRRSATRDRQSRKLRHFLLGLGPSGFSCTSPREAPLLPFSFHTSLHAFSAGRNPEIGRWGRVSGLPPTAPWQVVAGDEPGSLGAPPVSGLCGQASSRPAPAWASGCTRPGPTRATSTLPVGRVAFSGRDLGPPSAPGPRLHLAREGWNSQKNRESSHETCLGGSWYGRPQYGNWP